VKSDPETKGYVKSDPETKAYVKSDPEIKAYVKSDTETKAYVNSHTKHYYKLKRLRNVASNVFEKKYILIPVDHRD
jgi:hypothetical protein